MWFITLHSCVITHTVSSPFALEPEKRMIAAEVFVTVIRHVFTVEKHTPNTSMAAIYSYSFFSSFHLVSYSYTSHAICKSQRGNASGRRPSHRSPSAQPRNQARRPNNTTACQAHTRPNELYPYAPTYTHRATSKCEMASGLHSCEALEAPRCTAAPPPASCCAGRKARAGVRGQRTRLLFATTRMRNAPVVTPLCGGASLCAEEARVASKARPREDSGFTHLEGERTAHLRGLARRGSGQEAVRARGRGGATKGSATGLGASSEPARRRGPDAVAERTLERGVSVGGL